MVSDVVMTEHHVTAREVARDSVGMGAYGMDSHNVQRYITPEGYVRNEGNVQVGGFSPYPISYRSIVPRKGEAANLLVPVCLSATHIAYGSIRMEPVFMILGQSSAAAAVLAINAKTDVQSVDYTALRKRLLADGQILESPAGAAHPVAALDPAKLEGIVIDDAKSVKTGDWTESRASGSYLGDGYVHDGNTHDGKSVAKFQVSVPSAGRYRVRLLYPTNPNRATNALVTVESDEGTATLHMNQRKDAEWLGPYRAGKSLAITVSNRGADGYVVVDGVQVVAAKP
jgi:hypothetical protein